MQFTRYSRTLIKADSIKNDQRNRLIMKPIDLKNFNTVIAKDQPEYISLPAHASADGVITTCWELTFLERIKVLFFGLIYLQVMTFGKPLQPIKMSTEWEGNDGKTS